MSKLDEQLVRMERELRALTEARNSAVSKGREMIANANREYDQTAVPLSRRIEKLRARIDKQLQEAQTPRPRMKRERPVTGITVADGYTQEEVDHYYELLAKKGKQ